MPARSAPSRRRPADLREACVREALAIIETEGPERLSLREVARRLGVSHQAPYKHFASRDHLLAEIITRGFAAFAHAMETRPAAADPLADLAGMAEAYLAFAEAHPLHYRLMFGIPLADPEPFPEMLAKARHAFMLLTDALARLPGRDRGSVLLDALFVWSSLHGLAGIRQTLALRKLDLPAAVTEAAGGHVIARIGAALAAAQPD